MSLDLDPLLRAIVAHGRVARVVVADVAGSAPREVGASMLVWSGGQSGTIGGGELEFRAAARALDGAFVERIALGPTLGQCCGGAVTLLCEVFDEGSLAALDGERLFARSLDGGDMPLAVKRALSQARDRGIQPDPQTLQGWFIEPVARAKNPLWIYGAGHVGRALVDVIAPLEQFAITWVDTGPERFPDDLPDGVTMLPAAQPERAVVLAPDDARHLVLTYSHATDLALCHALLGRGFAGAGLIGSATKWARFRSRLRALGHSDARIDKIDCPIGAPRLGKTPQAIAIGVAAALLTDVAEHKKTNRGTPNDRDRNSRRSADA
ncbi:xanthine dehydrogenase accessory protein XdhC [Aliiroseovarius subalbicans]|uniref:xanthine dehydrogenase accessory protein XdhC n=1 Tax=Aliiroseovarius subalbicans TaxID=2925840 RepID=UPI001F57D78B|nr:xanthine dehydrogenase accessory protein XdhC [Aliiroseovarius subalbicans]MCI2400583.1 xanthine dehydrogenase accessory protein XdhC [Aliiroseovarius subalbicans]